MAPRLRAAIDNGGGEAGRSAPWAEMPMPFRLNQARSAAIGQVPVSASFPDLVPKLDDESLRRASLIRRLQPGPTLALLSGVYVARLALFLVIFALASAPRQVQETLLGVLGATEATEAFLREGVAGWIGDFLFFLGPDNLKPMTNAIVAEPLVLATVNGDIFLVGRRLYGLALIRALLRTLLSPITYLRARHRSVALDDGRTITPKVRDPARA